MRLDEAIEHAKQVAEHQRMNDCIGCAKEHKQLAEWLMELRHLKNIMYYLNNTIDMFCTKDGEEIYSFTNVQMWAEDELRKDKEV